MATNYQQDDDAFTSSFFGNQATPAGTPTPGTPDVSMPPLGGGGQAPASATPPGSAQQPTNALAAQTPNPAILGASQAPQESISNAPPTTDGTPLRTGTATPGGQAQAGDPIASMRDQVSRLSTITDPAQLASERDSLARNLFQTIGQAGHDVKWDGDVLVIDGRRYNVGGGQQAGITATNGGVTGGQFGAGNVVDTQGGPANPGTWDTDGYAAPAYTAAGGGAALPGWDQGDWDNPNHQTPKYVWGHIAAANTVNGQLNIEAAVQQLQQAYPGTTWDGKDVATIPGVGAIDLLRGSSVGTNAPQWLPAGAGGGAGTMPFDLGPMASPGAAGVALGGSPAATYTPPPVGAPPNERPDWMTGSSYTPGQITDDDIPDLDPATLLGQMGTYTPGSYQVGDLDVGPVEGDEESLVRGILGDPESINDQTRARMKVAGREQAAERGRQDDDELTALAYEGGFAGSPFVAGQRLARREQTNRDIANNERDIDIQADTQNAADRRAAAGVGSAYLSERGARQRGNESLRQSAAGMNESNAFNAAKLRSDNVTSAAKTALDAAAQRGDRMALRETVNQRAAELGLSSQKLMADYVTAQKDDLTRRYGIDVDAALKREGFDVDRMKLQMSHDEFQQELAVRMRQIALQYETDMSGIGLGYAKLDNDAYLGELNAMQNALFS